MVDSFIRLHTEAQPVSLATNVDFIRDYFQIGLEGQRTRCMGGLVSTQSSEFLDTLAAVLEVMVAVVSATHRFDEKPNITLFVCGTGSSETTGMLDASSSIPYSLEGLARVEQLVQMHYSRHLLN